MERDTILLLEHISVGAIIASRSWIPEGVAIPRCSCLPTGTVLPSLTIIPARTLISRGSPAPQVTQLPAGSQHHSCITLPNRPSLVLSYDVSLARLL
jgi:hypothetical protein